MPATPPSASAIARQPSDDEIVARTLAWVRHAVVGLNLCPFAARPLARDRIRVVVSAADNETDLLVALDTELHRLQAADRDDIETTLLVHPAVLQDFLDYNDFLALADDAVQRAGLEGEIQVASFHPAYRFAGSAATDIENATNRSPWPTLHLLREISVSEALDSIPDPDAIIEANGLRLRELGPQGWRLLSARWQSTDRP